MNLDRTLTRQQKFYLKQICSGALVLVWNEDYKGWVKELSDGAIWCMPHNKVRPSDFGRGLRSSRYVWLGTVVVELTQRGILEDVNGRLMPNKDAQRLYGTPPPISVPERVVKMHRTRAAREQ